MSEHAESVQTYTIRLELVDEPGELLNALKPIAEEGGNLLSILHERGNVTPRGRIPVEIDIECHPERIDNVVESLQTAGVNVVKAGEERFSSELSVLLIGHLVDADLSDTITCIEDRQEASVTDLTLSAPDGASGVASAQLRIATEENQVDEVLSEIRDMAASKGLTVVEPQIDRGGDA